MCKLCDDSLQAVARSAAMLASAAKDLYDMNDHTNSQILANAAGELFTPVKEEPKTGEAGQPEPHAAETLASDVKLPKGFVIDDDGVVSINGAAIGRVVVIGKPTKH